MKCTCCCLPLFLLLKERNVNSWELHSSRGTTLKIYYFGNDILSPTNLNAAETVLELLITN